MHRIIVNCLLLMSLVTAEPDARQKRHFSFFKDLFNTALFGGSQSQTREIPQIVNSEVVPQYQLYQVPGFDDVFVKALPSAPIIQDIVANDPGELLKIQPFESYIGTKNSDNTLATFQNVNNLLSTGVFDGEQTDLLRKTMVSMISGLNLPQEKIGAIPVISELKSPVQTEVVVNTSDENVNLENSFKPKYSYKQVEVDLPLIEVPANNNPEVIINEEIDPTSTIPCIDQRNKEVNSVSSNSNSMSKTETSAGSYKICNGQIGQHPKAINRFSPSGNNEPLKIDLLKPMHKKVPLSRPTASVIHFEEHINNAEATKAKPVDTSDKIDISQTLGPIPPQYIPSIITELNKPKSEDKDTKPTNPNIKISANKDTVDQITSHYVYKQASHDDPNAFSVVKEGNVLKTNVHAESPVINPVVHNTLNINATPEDKNVSHIDKSVPLVKDKDIEDADSQKIPEEVPEKGTLAYYIYERENRNKPKPFSIVEADEHKNYEDSPALIRYVYIPPDYDRLPETTNDDKTAVSAPIDPRMSHPNSVEKKRDNFVTDVRTASPSNQYVYIPPEIKTPVNSITVQREKATTQEHDSRRAPTIERASTKSQENSSVLKENGHISFKEDPPVVSYGKYVYHQSNPDGTSMSVKGNKDGVSVDVNERSSKGRGDVPYE